MVTTWSSVGSFCSNNIGVLQRCRAKFSHTCHHFASGAEEWCFDSFSGRHVCSGGDVVLDFTGRECFVLRLCPDFECGFCFVWLAAPLLIDGIWQAHLLPSVMHKCLSSDFQVLTTKFLNNFPVAICFCGESNNGHQVAILVPTKAYSAGKQPVLMKHEFQRDNANHHNIRTLQVPSVHFLLVERRTVLCHPSKFPRLSCLE